MYEYLSCAVFDCESPSIKHIHGPDNFCLSGSNSAHPQVARFLLTTKEIVCLVYLHTVLHGIEIIVIRRQLNGFLRSSLFGKGFL